MTTTLENALSFYNRGLFEGQFKKLQNMVKIFKCEKKEIYVIKEDPEEKARRGNNGQYESKVDELVENMMVNVEKHWQLSKDSNFNEHLHSLAGDESMMKMSLGKGDGKLMVYIRAIFDDKKELRGN